MTDDVETWVAQERARHEIRALAIAYQAGCDGGWGYPSHGNPRGLAELFTEDGSYKVPQRAEAAVGRDQITEVFAELQTSLPYVIHFLTNEIIEVTGDRADVRFNGIAAIWPAEGKRQQVYGVYSGTAVKVDGRWLFEHWQFDLAGPRGTIRPR
jgi:uncharacterized protein (TIGR02246 family)